MRFLRHIGARKCQYGAPVAATGFLRVSSVAVGRCFGLGMWICNGNTAVACILGLLYTARHFWPSPSY